MIDDRDSQVLTTIAQRASAALATSEAAQAYLRSVGVDDPSIWSAFNLGIGSPTVSAGLPEAHWSLMTQLGLVHPMKGAHVDEDGCILIPTFDPREHGRVVGMARIAFCQHRHRFLTPPRGVACGSNINTSQRIVLAEGILLGLRLTKLGVSGVACVEDPAALPPLKDWLAGRDIIVAGYYHRGRSAIIQALADIGMSAKEAALHPRLDSTTDASLVALGIDRESVRANERLEITPQVLRDVHDYSVGRIAAGCANQALDVLGMCEASIVGIYQIGYLPPDFHRALSPEQRRMLDGRLMGNSLIVPARDERGIIVDFMAMPVGSDRAPVLSLHREPRGLIAPAVTTSFDEIVVVDALRAAADLMTAGKRHVVLVRGLKDAQINAKRIAANGVRRAVVQMGKHSDEISNVLRAVGIAVAGGGTPESAPAQMASPPTALPIEGANAVAGSAPSAVLGEVALIHHDRRLEQATFGAGDVRYIAEVPSSDQARIGLRIIRGGQEHPDRLDLGEAAQRHRCATSAAQRIGIPSGIIETHLSNMYMTLRSLADQASESSAPANDSALMTESERRDAMELARRFDLFDTLIADLEELHWIGEPSAKRFALLGAISRKLSEPLWLAFPAGSQAIESIAAITPPEDCIHVSRLTENAFSYADPAALKRKLLIIDDLSGLSSGVSTALRILKRRGALSSSRVERDILRGDMRTAFVEVQGPVALFAAISEPIEDPLRPYFEEIAGDESPEQIGRILAAQRQRLAHGVESIERRRAISRLRHLQRILESVPVVMPFAEQIDGFGLSPRSRHDHETLMTLIAAHALLHQHQRPRADGAVVATAADFDAAAALMNERLAADESGLGRQAQTLLRAVWSAGRTSFNMDDLAALLPDWTRYAFRAGIDELLALDYLSSPRGGRGVQRTYHLHAGSARADGGRRISLRPVGELATVGETTETNPNPMTNTA